MSFLLSNILYYYYILYLFYYNEYTLYKMFYYLMFLQFGISERSISLTLITHDALSAH